MRPSATAAPGTTDARTAYVWYVSYGSNLCAARMACYLQGGRPSGAARSYDGCRDRSPATQVRPHVLPGALYFAESSPVWDGGGVAFLDPDGPGTVAARAYRITLAQFADVTAQELHRPVGEDIDLEALTRDGSASFGSGWYSRLLHMGDLAGEPVLTFTAPWPRAAVTAAAPSPAYLAMLATGLVEAHGWGPARVGRYLAAQDGPADVWTPSEVSALLG